MRRLLLPILLVVIATGCRTTHDATDEELALAGGIANGMFSSQDASGDMGQASASATSGLYGTFMALRKDDDSGGPGGSAGLFIVNEGREAWPDCVTELEAGVEYDACDFSASGDGSSVAFTLDGFYEWTDNSADADLQYDLAVSSSGISVGWTFAWLMSMEWTDTTLNGSYSVDYDYGVTTGGLPTVGGVDYTLNGTIVDLTWDDACGGVISGTIDYTYSLKQTGEPPDDGHVTVVWTGCGSAEITW